VWAAGWPAWKPWSEVSDIAAKVPPAGPPPIGADPVFHYHGPSGQGEHPASAIAVMVQADPGAKHSVWAKGFDGWLPAEEVEAIQTFLDDSPPPASGSGGPPPPPA
jgi:ABC-type glycerol-3-phosphate transport system substrate-binding protein